jgi:alginate O-acetyltransferase complex protein AlgI
MVFSSETFLFLFLPVFLGLYYLTPARFRSLTILAGSYLFYGWWRVDFLGLLILTTLWTYAFGLAIQAARSERARNGTLAIGLAGNLAVLGVFKYLNFFIDSFAALAGTDAAGLGIHWRLILPIGVSFYVFQSISYLIDVRRGDVRATTSFFDFAAFIALFPQLVAGPILRFKDLADQFQDRQHSPQLFADGLARFTIGLAKKVLIADALAPLADLAFSTPDPTAPLAWAGALAYMLQLYFDFSGYSDMAIGLGMMMGFRFMENFDAPYISRSITEFWRRWHISLSVWLRDYLYVPLGGNRKGPTRTYVNLVLVMLLGGLWHGANWTFVLWGAWHGGWLAAERATGMARQSSPTAHLRTLFIVLLGWVMFRALTVGQAMDVYAGLFGLNGLSLPPEIAVHITHESLVLILVAGAIALAEPRLRDLARINYFPTSTESLGALLDTPGQTRPRLTGANSLLPSLLVTAIAVLCVMRLAEQSFSPFLYFQF